jgi:hypothetical protein
MLFMTKRFVVAAALIGLACVASSHAAATFPSGASKHEASPVSVTTVDFLEAAGLRFNGAGPLLVKMDAFRNRLIVANTLSSSISIING